MPITKASLIETIRKELNRQNHEGGMGAICTYNETPRTIGVDGNLELEELADAILNDIRDKTN